jgi:hypothetical protein
MRILVLLLLAFAAAAQSPFEFVDVTPESIQLRENGQPVYTYNHGVMLAEDAPADRARCCYLHPLYSPAGVVVTDDFPKDHYHHRGVFSAWSIVSIDGKRHDLWLMKGIRKRFERWHERKAGPESARLAVENGWYAGEEKVVRENLEIVAHPARDGRRSLEFSLSIRAFSREIGIQGDPTDQKGYGGFSVRFAPRKDTVITTDSGVEAKDTNMVPHAWAELAATYPAGRAALRIDIDPTNPGAPNGWCLRHYGFLGVNYPGNEMFTLMPGQPLNLRYTVTVRDE